VAGSTTWQCQTDFFVDMTNLLPAAGPDGIDRDQATTYDFIASENAT